MTKEEFVEMLTIMVTRSTGGVLAARCKEDVGSEDPDDWASLLETIHGKLYVDDSDDPVTREKGGVSSKPLYELDKINTWPDGKWEKLSRLIWWIDPEDELNILDVLAAQTGITK